MAKAGGSEWQHRVVWRHRPCPAAWRHRLPPAAWRHRPSPCAWRHRSSPCAWRHNSHRSNRRWCRAMPRARRQDAMMLVPCRLPCSEEEWAEKRKIIKVKAARGRKKIVRGEWCCHLTDIWLIFLLRFFLLFLFLPFLQFFCFFSTSSFPFFVFFSFSSFFLLLLQEGLRGKLWTDNEKKMKKEKNGEKHMMKQKANIDNNNGNNYVFLNGDMRKEN